MLGKQEGFRYNVNYLTLKKRYVIVPSQHLHQLDLKVNVIQGSFVAKITSHKILDKIWVGFFQKVEEIKKGLVNNILLPDKNVHVTGWLSYEKFIWYHRSY